MSIKMELIKPELELFTYSYHYASRDLKIWCLCQCDNFTESWFRLLFLCCVITSSFFVMPRPIIESNIRLRSIKSLLSVQQPRAHELLLILPWFTYLSHLIFYCVARKIQHYLNEEKKIVQNVFSIYLDHI